MDILFISPYLPSETSGHAGAQLIFRNIVSLAKNHQITLAAFIDSGENHMIESLTNHGINVHAIFYPRNQKSLISKLSSGIRNIRLMVNSISGKEPFYFAKYKSIKMADLVSKLISESKFDFVQVEYNVMHHYTKQIGDIPNVVVFHDVSSKVYERGKAFDNKSNKMFFDMTKILEPSIANKFDAVVTLTVEDHDYLKNLGCESPIHVIPPQVTIPAIRSTEKNPKAICFVGSFNREPNIQAVQILIDELFPQLLDKIQLNIIGKDLPNYLVNKIKGIQGINYLGFIDDVDGFLASQMMMVAPIQIGSGLKMKIPHALACGTVVITTPVGAEGIGLEESDGLWIADSNETMVDIINNNIDELDLMIKQGLSGRNAVKEKFSENNIIPKFEILYSEILQA